MLLYICVKFHENISNGFGVTERTRVCDRQTDGRTDDQGKNNMSPNPTGGDIIEPYYLRRQSMFKFIELFQSSNRTVLKNLDNFIYNSFEKQTNFFSKAEFYLRLI